MNTCSSEVFVTGRAVCDPSLPELSERPLLDAQQAARLARLFKILANDSRLRLLHALVRGQELCVSELASTGGMTVQAVSNQLQHLVDLGILARRRSGNNVLYRVLDPCVVSLMDLALCLTASQKPVEILEVPDHAPTAAGR